MVRSLSRLTVLLGAKSETLLVVMATQSLTIEAAADRIARAAGRQGEALAAFVEGLNSQPTFVDLEQLVAGQNLAKMAAGEDLGFERVFPEDEALTNYSELFGSLTYEPYVEA